MPSYFVSLVLIFSISSCLICDIYAFAVCNECKTPAECEMRPPDLCIWGEHRNYCGRRTCSKGPGERCGGPRDVLGQCGEGLMCKSDELCHGCSTTTMNCFMD